jgi:hypothetical protein
MILSKIVVTRVRLAVFLRSVTIIVASITTTVWYATTRGQDFNWDQKNYHIGVPFLLAQGDFWRSIAPAGIQSYFNPYILELQYFWLLHASPIGFSIIVAAAQSTAFMIAGLACVEVIRSTRVQIDLAEACILSLIGFSLCLMAPVVLSESGTTFVDFVCAVPVVGAYTLLLSRHRVGLVRAAGAAGILLGLATVLKLTNGVFAIGAVGFSLAGPEHLHRRLQLLAVLGASTLLAFFAIGGSWQFALWEHFHNPIFPYYNNVFHSHDFGSATLRDERWLPLSVFDIWRYPLFWLLGGSTSNGQPSPSSELNFADARWTFLIFGGTIFLAALALFRNWRKQRLAEVGTGLLFAILISYLVWLAEFGYQRYLAPMDILCGAGVLFLVMQIPWQLERGLVLAAIAITSFGVLTVPDWGHLPWRSYWQAIDPTPNDVGGPSIIFLTDKPSSYIAASLRPEARYVGISGDFDLNAQNDSALTRGLKSELADAPKTLLKEVDRGSVPDYASAMLATYDISVSTKCQKFEIADEAFRICDVDRKLR